MLLLLYEPMKNNVIFLNMFNDVALCLSILNVSFYKANTLHGSGPKLEREEKELQQQQKYLHALSMQDKQQDLKKKIELQIAADLPAGTGMGSSGAFTAGLITFLWSSLNCL